MTQMSSRPDCPIAQLELNGTKGSTGFYPQHATVQCSAYLWFLWVGGQIAQGLQTQSAQLLTLLFIPQLYGYNSRTTGMGYVQLRNVIWSFYSGPNQGKKNPHYA